MAGIYMNLLLCSYGHFLTFCIVTDWCTTSVDDKKKDCAYQCNRFSRIFFHLFALVLFFAVFLVRNCEETLYPFAFCWLGAFILAAQIFDLAMYSKDYLIDLENMPKSHVNRIWYNRELF